MPYYTDKDRERAAARRKLNSQFRQIRKAPEDMYDIFGISVPRVTNKPTLDEYGLKDGVEERLKQADEEYIQKEKSFRKTMATIITLVFIGLVWFTMSQANQTNHPENYSSDGRLTNNAIAWGGAVLSLGGFFGGIYLWVWAFDVKPKQTYEHTQYEKYRTQTRYYEYWQRRKQKNFWNGMDGHHFENAVANLFRNIGFTAEVSKRGGDGGIDIVLQKANRKIAVQCKRYKSSVGPHVIRDLWGTMHYLGFDEGCIVTTTGFTKGVTSFAQDKNIFLIDLNDILRAIGDDGDSYLRKQIGEQV
jgi:restriction system protein